MDERSGLLQQAAAVELVVRLKETDLGGDAGDHPLVQERRRFVHRGEVGRVEKCHAHGSPLQGVGEGSQPERRRGLEHAGDGLRCGREGRPENRLAVVEPGELRDEGLLRKKIPVEQDRADPGAGPAHALIVKSPGYGGLRQAAFGHQELADTAHR